MVTMNKGTTEVTKSIRIFFGLFLLEELRQMLQLVVGS